MLVLHERSYFRSVIFLIACGGLPSATLEIRDVPAASMGLGGGTFRADRRKPTTVSCAIRRSVRGNFGRVPPDAAATGCEAGGRTAEAWTTGMSATGTVAADATGMVEAATGSIPGEGCQGWFGPACHPT